MIQTIKRLLYIIPDGAIRLAGMVILFLFSSGLEVIGIGAVAPFIEISGKPNLIHDNYLLKRLFDISGIVDENRFIAFLGFLIILLFCAKVFVAWLTQACIFQFGCRQQRLLINQLLDKYLFAPYTYHLKNNSSYIIDNIVEVAYKFNYIVQNLFVSVANIFIAFFLSLFLWHISSTVMLIMLIILLPILVLINSFKQKIRFWGEKNRKGKLQLIKTINHSLGGIKETKVIGCENYFRNQVLLHSYEIEASDNSFFKFSILPRFLIEAAMLISTVSVISYFLFMGNDITELHAILGVYALAAIRFLPAFSQTIAGINALRNHSYTINQIYFDLKELKREGNYKNQLSIPGDKNTNYSRSTDKLSFQKHFNIEHISYQYPNQVEFAIKNLSLSLNQGDSIAFVGKSGAGKTTLVDIILGLLIPQHGELKVDGVSIYENLRAWQNLVGYIPQSIFLADDTVKKNIAFGLPDELIDIDKLYQAIEAAQLSEVVNSLPNGIDTRVGERGVLLSGGQRQRIGIARALYYEREILVLDEATAALDNETEKLVTDAINALSGKKTLIVIAHRLSTVEHCDRIYQIEKGRVVKYGSYKEVIIKK